MYDAIRKYWTTSNEENLQVRNYDLLFLVLLQDYMWLYSEIYQNRMPLLPACKIGVDDW